MALDYVVVFEEAQCICVVSFENLRTLELTKLQSYLPNDRYFIK